MDEYDCAQIDKAMSKKIDAIYRNPAKHKFYSQFEAFKEDYRHGPRGGRIVGKKRICYHCGSKKKYHADITELL